MVKHGNRAYPDLNRAPEMLGFHKICFEVAVVLGLTVFNLTQSAKLAFGLALSTMFFINYHLKKDPQYFRLRPGAKRLHVLMIGFFRRNQGQPKLRFLR